MKIFVEAAKLEQQNRPFAMAQIIESRGSTPRHSGQMLVLDDGSVIGTIGGGMVERKVITEALLALAERKPRIFYGRMTRNGQHAVGSDCGGSMSVYIDVHGLASRLILIGAGHVNRAIAQTDAALDFEVVVLDVYADSLNAAYFPTDSKLLQVASFNQGIEQLAIKADDYVVIATNSQDWEALSLLIHLPVKYLGLLASRRKIHTFTRQLYEQGLKANQLAHLHAPIGLNIGAETPAEIAISIVAEMLQIKHQAAGGSLKYSTFPCRQRVIIRGAGDIATGVALRLYHAGFHVIMLEVAYPTVIRCTVAFAQAIYAGEMTIEGVRAKHITGLEEVDSLLQQRIIPVLIDEDASLLATLQPDGVVDAILAKQNRGTHRAMAPVTIALGPGFEAGKDCDAIVETNRGHNLGRVIYQGSAQANTGVPGNINGHTTQRVVRSPVAGVMQRRVNIGDIVNVGEDIAYIDDTPIKAPLSGLVRGLLNDNLSVTAGFKIGDIDPRGAAVDFTAVSDKARAIAGGVLEGLMALMEKPI